MSWPVNKDDIGGELVAILSKGLYTDPLDCVREYVQNAVDARARAVTIKITGNSVLVFDNGHGMSLEDLRQARQFGVSPKTLNEFVGFRGIGIYSGYDLCKRLRILSKQEGNPRVHALTFDFARMHELLNRDEKPSLLDLLSECTTFELEPDDYPVDARFTQVELQELSDIHIRQLSDRSSMRTYLLRNLPIDFSRDFEHRERINELLSLNVPGYSPIVIDLQSDGIADETVVKEPIEGLQPPTSGWINKLDGSQLAYFWACLAKDRAAIETPASRKGEQPSYAGFVYKIKGFTVGSRDRLRQYFKKRPQLYPWYTGEVYVVDPGVIPNAERDDFETSNAKVSLEFAVAKQMEELEGQAIVFQARGVADSRVDKYFEELAAVEAAVRGGGTDQFETYSRLDDIVTDLKRQKRAASEANKDRAEDILKRASKLQKDLRKAVDEGQSESTRRGRAARSATKADAPVQVVLDLPPKEQATLDSVLSEIGWELDERSSMLASAMQETLEAVLGRDSDAYAAVMREFARRVVSPESE